MRIVFSARPAFGHVFPMAPLAAAARDAGHEVVFASGDAFLPRLRGAGFEPCRVGESIEDPAYRDRAQAIRGGDRAIPSPGEVVTRLESLVADQ